MTQSFVNHGIASKSLHAPQRILSSSRTFFSNPRQIQSLSNGLYQQRRVGQHTRAVFIDGVLTPSTFTDLHSAATALFDIAELDSASAGTLAAILRPILSISSLLMIVRIVMTWYPEIETDKLPWSIAFYPTEPLLSATRKVVKPFNGLDVSPIVWVALLSFMSEILTGPQGILSLIERKGI